MKKFNIALALALAFAAKGQGQSTNLQIISAAVGDEGAIILKWQSESNAIYRIDYAPVLANTNTQWQTLYEEYGSHGTNTLCMDNGNYRFETPVERPKDKPARFYRIAKTGTNTAAAPYVSVTSPAIND